MRRGWRRALGVALVACAAGLPSLRPGFIHDDHPIVERNELISGPARAGEILTRGYWTVDARAVPNLYRPVTILSFAAETALHGRSAFGYRVVNLLLHAGVAVLLLRLARRALGETQGPGGLDGALFAALLFAVHPVHAEVLGLIVGRSEILAAGGVIATALLMLEARARAACGDRAGARLRVAAAAVTTVLSVFAKENGASAPFVALAAAVALPAPGGPAPARRLTWGAHAVPFAALAAALLARFAVLGAVGPAAFTPFIDNPIAHLPFPRSTATALLVAARYAALLVWPHRLSIDWSYDAVPPAGSLLEAGPILGGLLLLGGLAAAAVLLRRRPAAAFGLLLLGLSFAPVSNLLLPIGTLMAERLLYLPSAGFALVAGALVDAGRERFPRRAPAATVGLAVLLAALAARSIVRLGDFRDDRTLFASAVEVAPGSVRAQYNLGVAAEEGGDDAAAGSSYRAAIAVWPEFADAQFNLGGVLGRRGDWAGAVEHYQAALAQQPSSVPTLVNLGNALTRAGRAAEAAETLRRAVAIDAGDARAWTTLGTADLALGRAADAARDFSEAARLAPASPESRVNLALALDAGEDAAGAAAAWAAAAALRPSDPMIAYRQGRALERARRPEEAEKAYRAAIGLSPRAPLPWKALGLLLEARGDHAGARDALERAVSLDGGGSTIDPEARRVLDRLRRTGAPGR